mmetsp:Transcript_83025/g.256690  ORF Transcript_83025/g.256690 Transcript_83025/m.256690 type:complete len:781 (+) Transcript_83025:55-2397(+)
MQCAGFAQRRDELRHELTLFAGRIKQDIVVPALEEHRRQLLSDLLLPALAELRAQVKEDLVQELSSCRVASAAPQAPVQPRAPPPTRFQAPPERSIHMTPHMARYRGTGYTLAANQWQRLLDAQASEGGLSSGGEQDDEESSALKGKEVEAVARPFQTHATDFTVDVGGLAEKCPTCMSVAMRCGDAVRPCASAVGGCVSKVMVQIASHPALDYVTCAVIILNAVILAVETDYRAKHPAGDGGMVFTWSDIVFCVFFCAELALRVCAYGWELFAPANIGWTIFDTVVVGFQVLELVFDVMQSTAPLTNISFLRVVRIFRTLRVLRVFRLIHLIVELRTMLSSIFGSLKSLFWVVVLYAVMVFTAGTFFTQVVTEHRGGNVPDLRELHGITAMAHSAELSPHEVRKQLDTYYGSLGTTILSLWECISGGMDWKTLFDPLLAGVSPWVAMIFLGYVIFATVAMMNVVTGVFLEHAMRYAERDQDLYLARNILSIFGQNDLNADGEISMSVWEAKLGEPDMQALFRALNVDPSDATTLFKLIDLDDSGNLALSELIDGWARLRGQAKSLDLALLMRETDRANQAAQQSLIDIKDCLAWVCAVLEKGATSAETIASGPLLPEPSAVPQPPEPSAVPQPPEPSAVPQPQVPSAFLQLPVPSAVPQLQEPSAAPPLREPAAVLQPQVPSAVPQSQEPSAVPQLQEEAQAPGGARPLTSAPSEGGGSDVTDLHDGGRFQRVISAVSSAQQYSRRTSLMSSCTSRAPELAPFQSSLRPVRRASILTAF